VTAELNIHLEDPVTTQTVRRELHRSNIHHRAAIAKLTITENNTKRRKDGVLMIKPGRLMTGMT